MEPQAWIAVVVLAATIFLFVTKLIPLEATALSIPVVLVATGVIDAHTALQGFGNHAVIAIGAVFIVGAGLKESGVATLMARGLESLGGGSRTRTLFVIMVPACFLSAFMSSAATVAVLLPAVMLLARRTGTPVSKLLMPLGFAAILGGSLTLVGTTPNLILGEEVRLRSPDGVGLGMFEFTKIGLPVAALGLVYLAFVAVRFLKDRPGEGRLRHAQGPEELARSYGFHDNLYLLLVVPRSPTVGKTIDEVGFGGKYGLTALQIHRPKGLLHHYIEPTPGQILEAGDEILVEGEAEACWRLSETETLQLGVAGPQVVERILARGVALAEVTLTPHSHAIDSTLRQLEFRSAKGLNVVSLWRRGKVVLDSIGLLPLHLGDALLVCGPPRKIRELSLDPDYVVLSDQRGLEDVRKAPLALIILALTLLPPVLGLVPLAISALAGALLMVGSRCISLSGARRAVDWRILFLIIGTIPLGRALEEQGVAAMIGDTILGLQGTLGEPGVLLVLFALASLLSMTCNNGASAVILAPVAAQVASAGGVDLHDAFLAVAFGATCVFMLPFGNQCNLMIMGPGGYRTLDFLRAGAGLTIIMAATTVVLLTIM